MFGANPAYHAEYSARATPDEEWHTPIDVAGGIATWWPDPVKDRLDLNQTELRNDQAGVRRFCQRLHFLAADLNVIQLRQRTVAAG